MGKGLGIPEKGQFCVQVGGGVLEEVNVETDICVRHWRTKQEGISHYLWCAKHCAEPLAMFSHLMFTVILWGCVPLFIRWESWIGGQGVKVSTFQSQPLVSALSFEEGTQVNKWFQLHHFFSPASVQQSLKIQKPGSPREDLLCQEEKEGVITAARKRSTASWASAVCTNSKSLGDFLSSNSWGLFCSLHCLQHIYRPGEMASNASARSHGPWKVPGCSVPFPQ